MELTPPTGAEVLTKPSAVTALSVACPTCKRRPGQKCISAQKFVAGVVLPSTYIDPHLSRKELAEYRAGGITR